MLQNWTYIVGIILGSITILTASVVWYRKQEFGIGGGALSIIGVILIGLSLWSNVKIKLPGGIEAVLNKMEERIEETAEASFTISQELEKMATISETTQQQVVELTHTLEADPRISQQDLSRIRKNVQSIEPVNRGKLKEANTLLKLNQSRVIPLERKQIDNK